MRWRGRIVEVTGAGGYRVKIDYDNSRAAYIKGRTYDFLESDIEPAEGMSVNEVIDKLKW